MLGAEFEGAEFVRGRVCQGPSLLGAEMSRNLAVFPYLNKFQDTSVIIKLSEFNYYKAHDVEQSISKVFYNTIIHIRVTILYKIPYLPFFF